MAEMDQGIKRLIQTHPRYDARDHTWVLAHVATDSLEHIRARLTQPTA